MDDEIVDITPALATFFDRLKDGANIAIVNYAIRQLLHAEIDIKEFLTMAVQARGGQIPPPNIAEKIRRELVQCPFYLNKQAERAIANLQLQ